MLDLDKNQPVPQEKQYYISVLSFDGIDILLPQNEISSVESIYEFEKSTQNEKHQGYILNRGEDIAVYGFSSSLELISSYAGSGRPQQCIILNHSYGKFAILCQDIRNMIISNIHFQLIPECMNSGQTPLTHICLYQEANNNQKVGMVSNADALFNYIRQVEKPV